VRTAFLALQDAWCRQNLDAGRAFLSPGAYFTWSAQLETMAAEGRRNIMENLSVLRIDPVQIVHGRVFDDLTVRVSASAVDFEVDKENRIVFGDRSVRSFIEDLDLQRSVGVATTDKPGTLENTCPGCGAPIALNQIGECRYCRAAVTSGKFDWVVSRIEQDQDAAGTEAWAGHGGTGRDLALQVGSAIVGGLLANLLSDRARINRAIGHKSDCRAPRYRKLRAPEELWLGDGRPWPPSWRPECSRRAVRVPRMSACPDRDHPTSCPCRPRRRD